MNRFEELRCILQKNRNIPYPEIPKLYPNPRYCQRIYDSFAGKEGELTAITQYIYEHMYFQQEKGISTILQEIAIEEMKHLNILGKILVTLGGKPIYQNSQKRIWSAQNLDYNTCDIKEAMKKNIKAEEKAILDYRKLLYYTKNPYLRKVYERIILDEETHLKIFRKILQEQK